MAPEIMNKQVSPDIFTDAYSLAVILFELLRVGHPYVGDMVEDGINQHLHSGLEHFITLFEASRHASANSLADVRIMR